MSDLKITVDQLKNYLGTGLRVKHDETIVRQLIGIRDDFPILEDFGVSRLRLIAPYCYCLSDLDKFIPELGFVPIEELTPYAKNRLWVVKENKDDLSDWNFQDMQKLFEWHFWPFGDEYLESGLVIDKMKSNA